MGISERINHVMNTERKGKSEEKSTDIPFYGAYAGQLPLQIDLIKFFIYGRTNE